MNNEMKRLRQTLICVTRNSFHNVSCVRTISQQSLFQTRVILQLRRTLIANFRINANYAHSYVHCNKNLFFRFCSLTSTPMSTSSMPVKNFGSWASAGMLTPLRPWRYLRKRRGFLKVRQINLHLPCNLKNTYTILFLYHSSNVLKT